MNLPAKSAHILVLTGEPSGDFHAARLVAQICRINPGVYISGIGGAHLRSQKVDLFYDIAELSAMGVSEVLMQFASIKKAFSCFRQKLRVHPPDLIILVDYPGFNLKAARYAKEHCNTKILYYITPKVWAWKKSRLKTIARYVDHAALILPFEEKIFKSARIPATYVGNPLIDEYPESTSCVFTGPCTDKKPETANNLLTISLLPGSRTAEITNLLGIMLQAAGLIHQQNPAVKFLISKADAVQRSQIETIIRQSQTAVPDIDIYEGPVKSLLQQSDLVIAASGTVTLEAALCGVPTILIYRVSALTYRIARFFVKIPYVGLANLICNKPVMPELLQADANADKISAHALHMLENLPYFCRELQSVRRFLGKKGASLRTARIALKMLRDIEFDKTT